MNCSTSRLLAYVSIIYSFASIFYILCTRQLGTPFNDTLTETQKKIKHESAETRKHIFVKGIVIGMVLVFIIEKYS